MAVATLTACVARAEIPPPTVEEGPGMVTGRQASKAARLEDGRLVFFGGHGAGFVSLGTAEVWSPAENRFTQVTMNHTHDTPCFTRLADGRVLLAGGASNLGVPAYATSELFDPSTGVFTPIGNMVRFRAGGGAVQLAGGKVLVAGAWWVHNDAHTYGELLDLGTSQFSATGPLNTPRAYPVVVALDDGDALVLGGSGPTGQDIGIRIERYRAASNDFVAVSDELFAGESGWRAFEHPRAQSDQRLADGRYVFLAWRSAGTHTEYALFTVDPVDGAIARLESQPALPDSREASLLYPVPSVDGTRVLMAAVRTGAAPAAYFGMTLDVATGALAVPDASLDGVPGYLLDGTLHVTADDRLLVAGGSTQPDNFTAVNRTTFIAPGRIAPPLALDALLLQPAGNPRILELNWLESLGSVRVQSASNPASAAWDPVEGSTRSEQGRVYLSVPVDPSAPVRLFRLIRP